MLHVNAGRLAALVLACTLFLPLAPTGVTLAAVPTPAPAPGQNPSAPAPAPSNGSSTAPPPAATAARSVVSGSILLDEDLDGSPSRGDRRLLGVTVRLAGPVNSTAASGGGGFAFEGLPAGTYTVSVALPGGVVPMNGTARTVTVDGRSVARADFFVARPEKAPAQAAAVPPTPTPFPTATPVPTSTPKPLPTPVAAPGYTAPNATDASRAASASSRYSPNPTGSEGAQFAPRPIVTSLNGLRYAPGRSSPSMVEPVRTETTLWLGVPFMTQLDGTSYGAVNCGPASLAMVLGTFGIRATPAYIRDYVNYISGVYSSSVGTSLDHLARVAREAGLEVSQLYGGGGGYLRWSTALLREVIASGRPVMTLVKYRALPGNGGSQTEFDHYVVISGLAGNDFIYNDAIFTNGRGYGLLISPGDLERAWDYSSIPRHGMAVGLSGEAQAAALGQLEPGEDSSGEELLAEGDLSLGDELQFQDAFGGLALTSIFQAAIDYPASEQPASEPEGTLELAGFVYAETSLAETTILGYASAAPSIRAPVGPAIGPELAGPLAWASFAALVVIFGVTGRRLLA